MDSLKKVVSVILGGLGVAMLVAASVVFSVRPAMAQTGGCPGDTCNENCTAGARYCSGGCKTTQTCTSCTCINIAKEGLDCHCR